MDELFEKLRNCLFAFGPDVEHRIRKKYDSFWHDTGQRPAQRVFAYVHRESGFLGVNVRPGLPLDDDFVVAWKRKIACRRIKIRNESDLKRACPLLRKCYEFRGEQCDPVL